MITFVSSGLHARRLSRNDFRSYSTVAYTRNYQLYSSLSLSFFPCSTADVRALSLSLSHRHTDTHTHAFSVSLSRVYATRSGESSHGER